MGGKVARAQAGIGFVLSCGVTRGLGLQFVELQELIEGSKGGSFDGGGTALEGGEGAGRVVAQRTAHHGVCVGGAAVGDHVLDHLGFETTEAGETPTGLAISSTMNCSWVLVGWKVRWCSATNSSNSS